MGPRYRAGAPPADRAEPAVAAVPAVAWFTALLAPVFLSLVFFENWVIPSSEYFLPALLNVVLVGAANVCFIRSVSLAPLSLAIPILSLTPVFSAVGAYFLLGENVSALQIAGITIIVVAAFFLSAGDRTDSGNVDAKRIRHGIFLMIGVAAMFAVTGVVDKFCLKLVPIGEHCFVQCVGSAGLFFLYLKYTRTGVSIGIVRRNSKLFALTVLFAAVALFAQLSAIQSVEVGIFEALKRSIGLVAALILGKFLFGERITKAKVGLVGLIIIGISVLLV